MRPPSRSRGTGIAGRGKGVRPPAMRAAREQAVGGGGPRPRVPAAWKKGPGGPSAERYGERERGRRGASPRGAPRPSPPDAGRAPSTGQRRPALPRADPAVPSALGGLASGFGMGPGVPRPPWPLTGGRRSSCDDENASHAKGNLSACPGGRTASSTDRVSIIDLSCTRQAHAAAPAGMRRVRARAISAARLRLSPALHLRPINQVVYLGPYRKEN